MARHPNDCRADIRADLPVNDTATQMGTDDRSKDHHEPNDQVEDAADEVALPSADSAHHRQPQQQPQKQETTLKKRTSNNTLRKQKRQRLVLFALLSVVTFFFVGAPLAFGPMQLMVSRVVQGKGVPAITDCLVT